MKKFSLIGLLALSLFSLNSCYINRTTVGDGPTSNGGADKVRYSHAKQVSLFWGLIAIGHPAPALPTDCGYQLKTSFNVVDGIIMMVTGGLVGTRNIKILVNKGSKCDPKGQNLKSKKN